MGMFQPFLNTAIYGGAPLGPPDATYTPTGTDISTQDRAQYVPPDPVWSATAQYQALQSLQLPAQKGTSTVKTRGAIILGFLLLVTMAFGQSDSSIHVNAFPGKDVGTKISNAMATCPDNNVPCILVVDAGLVGYAQGVTPSMCAHCYLEDYRNGLPSPGPSALTAMAGVYPVTAYGAVGDCSGSELTASCTDNHAAIQAAIDAAYIVGGAVYFPTNPQSTDYQTVYYTSQPINPKGVSIYGPLGASGASQNWADLAPVAVRGAPGKDVFDIVDPVNSGFVSPRSAYHVRDLAILVDSSVDASASYPTRRPGKTVFDAAMSNGSAVVTSNTATFEPGDVGQAVEVYGAGSSGGNLTGTILSVETPALSNTPQGPFTQATLSVSASTAVSAAQAYISVLNLSVAQNIGNCAWASDDSTDSPLASNKGPGTFEHVVVQTVGGTNFQNNSCGYFFQGNFAPYQARWEYGYVGAEFSFAFVPPSAKTTTSGSEQGFMDYNVIDHIWIEGLYPWLSYDGGDNHVQDVQIYALYGPHVLDFYGQHGDVGEGVAHHWKIDIPEFEVTEGCSASVITLRLAGVDHSIDRLGMSACTPSVYQWDANASTVGHMYAASGIWNITGYFNDFGSLGGGAWIYGTTWNVSGFGNTLTTAWSENAYSSTQAGRKQYVGLGVTAPGPALLSRGSIAFNRTHDFLEHGGGNYYLNDEDLWIWPTDASSNSGTLTREVDPASDSGMVFKITTNSATLMESNGVNWVIGTQFPAGKFRVYIKAKANTSLTSQFVANIGVGSSYTQLYMNLSTAFTVGYVDVDATGAAGQSFSITPNTIGAGNTLSIAWIGIRPWDTDLETASLCMGAGNCMTGNHGAAANVQHSDGTGTAGPAYFTSTGDLSSTISPGKQLANCGTMTTTAAASNSLSCSWVGPSSICAVTPNNSTAVAWTYYTPTSGSVTVYHASTAGATYGISCSAN